MNELRVGDRVLYYIGKGEWATRALVKLRRDLGEPTWEVCVEKIYTKGVRATIKEGDVILALDSELSQGAFCDLLVGKDLQGFLCFVAPYDGDKLVPCTHSMVICVLDETAGQYVARLVPTSIIQHLYPIGAEPLGDSLGPPFKMNLPPEEVLVAIGVCDKHIPNLKRLEELVDDGTITPEKVQQARQFSAE